MTAARAQLELARQEQELEKKRLVQAEQALLQARVAARAHGRYAQAAAALGHEADWMAMLASKVRKQHLEAERAAAEVAALAQELEQRRAAWKSCLARREAAELHDALERREQRRLRAQRERSQDDEARDRFAMARGRVK